MTPVAASARRLGAYVLLARPHFLAGGLLYFGLGAALARGAGATLGTLPYLLGQAFVTLVQLAVHFGNEFHDLAADRANRSPAALSGGSRVLVDGRLPPGVARASARALFAAAVALVPALARLGGVRSLAVALLVLTLSWAYSAPPLRLHSRGVGELAAGLVVAGLVPLLALALADAQAGPGTALRLAPGVLQVAALVAVLSLPDVEGDRAAAKRTLAVRVGPRLALRAAQLAWLGGALATAFALLRGGGNALAVAGGSGVALALLAPALARERRWDALALAAAAQAGLQAALVAWGSLR